MRYFAGLAVAVAVAALLSLALGQRIATEQMVSVSQVSSMAALLPLVAGAAGAMNLIQSERSSLVSGAAVGVLVAAALAPPAGLVGMAVALARWDLAVSGSFVLLLQLAAINLSGALLFRLAGLTPQGPLYGRGTDAVCYGGLAATALALVALLAWQFSSSPEFQRSSISRRAAADVQEVVQDSGLAELVEVNVRFTRARIAGQNSLLCVVYVQRRADAGAGAAEVRQRLGEAIRRRLLRRGFQVAPLVDVTVFEPPGAE